MLGIGHDPCVSPDGKRIAYTGECTGGASVFTMIADASDKRQIVPDANPWGAIFPAWSPDGKWISFRHTDERYWSNPERMKKIYAEHPGDKRPVWIVHPDGSEAQLVEVTRFGCAMDGSRAQWKPTSK